MMLNTLDVSVKMPISSISEQSFPKLLPPLAVRSLRLTGFRNHAASRLTEIDAPLVVLTGANGAGKTNVLEALSLLAPGRGLRRAAFADMARLADTATPQGMEQPRQDLARPQQGMAGAGWALHVELLGLRGAVDVGMQWTPGDATTTDGGGARQLKVAGKTARSAAALAEHVRVAWLTPAMDGLFTGAASERRRFIDRLTLAVDPAHGGRINALERLLRQRNRLLPEWRAQGRWLDAIEAQLAEVAVAVAAARLITVEAMAAGMALLDTLNGVFPRAALMMRGWLEERLQQAPAVEVEDAYRAHLARARAQDAAAGRTLAGAHRSDLEVAHVEKSMPAKLCSTGEQKALLIALMLAHAQAVKDTLGAAAPLLLLDEVAAHLDAQRRAGLFAALQQLGAQAWMTGTDVELFADLHGAARFFVIDNGQVRIG